MGLSVCQVQGATNRNGVSSLGTPTFFPPSFANFYIIQSLSWVTIGMSNANPISQDYNFCLDSDIKFATMSRVHIPNDTQGTCTWLYKSHLQYSLVAD